MREGKLAAQDVTTETPRPRAKASANEALDKAKRQTLPRPHSPNLLTYDQMIRLTPPDWLVKDVLPRNTTAVIFGESNSFKSFIAVDLGCSVALLPAWHGHAVKHGDVHGNVVYVASESAYGIATKRIPAWMAHHNIPAEKRRGIFLRLVPPLLDDPKSLAVFKADIASAGPLAMIVYDVLAGTMRGSEKDTDVIAAWVRVVGDIEAQFGCAQLFVTHSPYGDAARMRGGTHLWGSFGTRLKAEGDREKRTTVLSVERHKDHDSVGLRWGFKLDVTDIDEFAGETSLVPVKDDAVTTTPKGAKLTGAAAEALKSFKYGLEEGAGRKGTSDHIPAGVDVLSGALWWLYFDKQSPSETEGESRRKRFGRGTKRLTELGLAAKWGDDWWLTDPGKATP